MLFVLGFFLVFFSLLIFFCKDIVYFCAIFYVFVSISSNLSRFRVNNSVFRVILVLSVWSFVSPVGIVRNSCSSFGWFGLISRDFARFRVIWANCLWFGVIWCDFVYCVWFCLLCVILCVCFFYREEFRVVLCTISWFFVAIDRDVSKFRLTPPGVCVFCSSCLISWFTLILWGLRVVLLWILGILGDILSDL